MAITLWCPECGSTLSVQDEQAAERAKCPQCQVNLNGLESSRVRAAASRKAQAEMKFAWIPPGWFLMGGPGDAEKPVHKVTITRGYWMGVSPVTQAQWAWVMGSGNRPSHFQGDDRPVEQVSWDEAQVFLARMKELTGKPVRLPTEAEWEYACRAGTTTDYHSGNGENLLQEVAWFDHNSDEETHPVGQKKPNEWGLYDMHGNVWEWCQDLHDDQAYSKRGPGNVSDPVNVHAGAARVLRGGSWGDSNDDCRAASRGWDLPDARNDNYGFRVCFTPE